MNSDQILPNILILLVVAVVSYLFGAIPSGVVIGQVFFKKDIRQLGSHNTGGTNAGRVLGKKVGIAVIFLDMVKTIVPFYLAWALLTYVPALRENCQWANGYNAAPAYYWGTAVFTCIGHCWSIFLGFKGGKAVSCFMGINIFTSWIQFVLPGFGYLFVAKKTKFISLSSIIIAVFATVVAWVIAIIAFALKWNTCPLTWMFVVQEAPVLGFEFAIVDTFLATVLILRHRSNIKRLREGTESKNPFAK